MIFKGYDSHNSVLFNYYIYIQFYDYQEVLFVFGKKKSVIPNKNINQTIYTKK